MGLDLPSQRNCLACFLTFQNFAMFKLSKITFGLGLKQNCILNNCLQSRHSDNQIENFKNSLELVPPYITKK